MSYARNRNHSGNSVCPSGVRCRVEAPPKRSAVFQVLAIIVGRY